MTFRALCGSLWDHVGLCGPLCGWHVTNKPQHGPDLAPEPHRAAQGGILGQLGWLWPAERLTVALARRRATSDPFRRLGNGQVNGKRCEKRDYTGALASYGKSGPDGARAAHGRQVRQARGKSTAYSVLTRGMAWGPRVVPCQTCSVVGCSV